jgi:hypothetical protein
LAPDYAGIELGIGESILIKAISEASGRNAAKVKADLKKEGDLGLVAMVRHHFSIVIAPLTIRSLLELESQSEDDRKTETAYFAICFQAAQRNCFQYRPCSKPLLVLTCSPNHSPVSK